MSAEKWLRCSYCDHRVLRQPTWSPDANPDCALCGTQNMVPDDTKPRHLSITPDVTGFVEAEYPPEPDA